ncbi:alpha-mannosidase [Enterococcus sp. JM4C]|uniref:GH92 family glycosyl hydrolase n=1 Tax=Candidatus Enterococcus huntleyi TaxID=1857217 RepID=UPI0013795162|nr:GH92 family glycosyl hydrolase [Enterococcus sp. JM4C]KAF1296663.1 alpha-mannosidase [Enterococcus sp. JM4C]
MNTARIETIDTRHGTENQHSFSNGNCLPYTGVPFGMNYFAPQTTNQKGSWWFHPKDRTFQGYRLTHQPSPWMGDYSHLLLLPYSGELSEPSLFHAQSSYRPEESTFCPSHLSITALRYQITSTLIPSLYGGLLDIEYSDPKASLLLALGENYQLDQINDTTLSGYVINYSGCEDPDFKFYFTLKFAAPIQQLTDTHNQEGIVLVQFGDIAKQTAQLGTSFISSAQATLNLEREITQTAANYLTNSQTKWQSYLDKIDVRHHDKAQVATFYHNLYRTFLFPQTFYEIDGTRQKIHYDTYSKTVRPGVLYTNNGFWDTYKTVYPLYSLIAKEEYGEMLEGFLNSYKETGFLPKWLSPDERGLMPGTLIDAVIADAAVKNIRPDLMPEFLEAMKKAATIQSDNPNYGRQGTYDYLKYGYVPLDYHESVNHTLDYCYSDFCIHQVAEILGDSEKEFYKKQTTNYKNLFDPTVGFMRAKDQAGNFRENFLDTRWGKDYAEGSAWQSSFAVYHDFAGLIDAHGGSEAFEEKLITLCNQAPRYNVEGYGFEIHEMSEMAATEFGQLAISNQPSFHYPFLFSYIGKPEMAQPLLKQLMTQEFDASSTGFPGDEDNGSMAAWYIFNALGFYPVCPGSGEYVLGMPLFDQVTIHLSTGENLTLTAGPNYPQQQFINGVKRNGQSHEALFFTHEDLVTGGTIDYHLGTVPRPKNYSKEQLPFSLSN